MLSDAGMRREYDRQLAEYRQQSVPAAPPREPKAAATSQPRSYASPPTRAPQPRAGAWGAFVRVLSWGTFAIPLIVWVAIAVLIQQSDSCGSREPPRTESTLQQASGTASTPTDIASYCKAHPTSSYGAPGTASGVSCSDWARLSDDEQQSFQAACSKSQYFEGPTVYDQCLFRQLKEWESAPKQPNLSRLTDPEHSSIQAACSTAKYLEGPAAYDRCLVRNLEAWESSPKRPDLSHLTDEKQKSIESACSAKFMLGPAEYDRCLVRELEDTSILPSMRRSSMSHEVIRKTDTSSFNSP